MLVSVLVSLLVSLLDSLLGAASFATDPTELEAVIDEPVPERLDTIIKRRPRCPDCVVPEADGCEYLGVPGED